MCFRARKNSLHLSSALQFIKLILLSNPMMNCPIDQMRKLRLLLEGFTQDHSTVGLELRS